MTSVAGGKATPSSTCKTRRTTHMRHARAHVCICTRGHVDTEKAAGPTPRPEPKRIGPLSGLSWAQCLTDSGRKAPLALENETSLVGALPHTHQKAVLGVNCGGHVDAHVVQGRLQGSEVVPAAARTASSKRARQRRGEVNFAICRLGF